MRRWFVEHGALARGAFVVAVLVSLAVQFAPASDVPGALAGFDLAVHAVMFAALALTARWAGVRLPAVAGLLLVYATAAELVQATDLVGRDGSVGDWAADLLGAAAGLLGWHVLTRSRPAG
jgi:hypothetical protein